MRYTLLLCTEVVEVSVSHNINIHRVMLRNMSWKSLCNSHLNIVRLFTLLRLQNVFTNRPQTVNVHSSKHAVLNLMSNEMKLTNHEPQTCLPDNFEMILLQNSTAHLICTDNF
jgi:hypothetical protein